MKQENAIEVQHISKSFKIYRDRGNSLKDLIVFGSKSHYERRMVLKDISFEVKKGEAIGLIGHNGCGKSTTLKLLTKIMYPDSGTIEMKGRVSSLIELGAGCHPDMSGRENIYINASIFGLSRREIDARLDDIIAFSELEDFIDNPVRTYSSGMYARLAFSVAINVEADILLVDEILAVGDAAFQKKCFEKLKEIKAEGTTIIIVTHSLTQVEEVCERSLWIDEGVIRLEGRPSDVHQHYLEHMGVVISEGENNGESQNYTNSSVLSLNPEDILIDDVYANYGFHEPEIIYGKVYRWMAQEEAQLIINASKLEDIHTLKINYFQGIPLDQYSLPFTLQIRVNDGEWMSVEIPDKRGHIEVPLGEIRKLTILDLKISHLWLPGKILDNGDSRQLGIAINVM